MFGLTYEAFAEELSNLPVNVQAYQKYSVGVDQQTHT